MTDSPADGARADVKEAVTQRRRVPVLWLLPVAAIILAVALVLERMPEPGLDVTLHIEDGSGIEANTTLIKYQGIRVGIVEEVTLAENLEHVVVKARLTEQESALAREGTRFWVVRPHISLHEIRGLETLVAGPYIELQPGPGEKRLEFTALTSEPLDEPGRPGLNIIVVAKRAGSLRIGTPVWYRDVKIGEVYQYQLQKDARRVEFYVHIDARYRALIRDNSVFWNASGFELDVSLFGANLSTESIKGILTGGISVATPDEPGQVATQNSRFVLEEEQREQWLRWEPAIKIESEKIVGPPPKEEKIPPPKN